MDEQDLLIAELREQLEMVRRERDEFRDDCNQLRVELRELQSEVDVLRLKLEWDEYTYD